MAESVSTEGTGGRAARAILTLLRIAIGWHFLYEGHAKFMQGHWTSAGYLAASRWWFGGAFQWLAAHAPLVTVVDALNIGGQVVIGLLLMTGTVTRAASLAGVALLLLYYLANPPLVGLGLSVPADGHYLVVDRNLIEMLTLAFLAALPATALPGVDRWFLTRRRQAARRAGGARGRARAVAPAAPARVADRRALLANLAGLPFLGAFAYALLRKHRWQSYEERNLVDAVTAASTKTLDVASLRELKGTLPVGKIGGRPFSRLILGGNLLSGWAHSRDLIYVSQLVKAYHNKDRIFATLLVAEKCGVNTLLTNPILCTLIDEYWKRRIGKIQFISDCAGLEYDDKGPHPMAFDKYLDKVQRAIDYGAAACYIQGETADYYIKNAQPDRLIKVVEKIRANKVLVGIGAHHLETVQGLRGRRHDAGLLDEDPAPPRLLVGAPPRVARQHVLQQPGRDDRVDGRAQGALDRLQGDGGRGDPPEGGVPLRLRARGRLRVRRHVRLPDGRGRQHRARRARSAGAGVAAAALEGVGACVCASRRLRPSSCSRCRFTPAAGLAEDRPPQAAPSPAHSRPPRRPILSAA